MKPLKPVMAALLAACSFASPLAGIAFADSASDAAANDAAVVKLTALNRKIQGTINDAHFFGGFISSVDSNKAARDGIGERLAQFIQGKDQGKQYLTDGLLGDKVLLPGAIAAAKNWPETNKSTAAAVAALYYVLGAGSDQPPAWAPADLKDKYKDEFKTNAVWSGRLAAYLSDAKWNTTKRVAQSNAANDTIALLNDAAKWAQKILDDARTKGEIHDSIVANDTTGVTPPTTAKPRNPLDGTGSGFSFDDLYKNGAETGNVFNPNDKGFRTLSMKVYTTQDATGHLISQIGVVDITAGDITSPTVPQFIDVSKPGDTDITMRDGGRHYTVTVGADGSVTLKRAGAKDGDGGGTISTSISQLSADRNAQISNSGTVLIGGQPYHVLGQGGSKGSYLFFSDSQMQHMPVNGNPHPELMGDVSEVIGDGSSAPIKGKPDLGTLQDGSPWHLEFDMQSRMWKVMPGAGDKKGNSTPAGSTDTTTSPVTSTDTTTNTDPTTNPATGPATTLEQAIAIAKQDKPDKTQVWTEDAGNAGFSPDVLAKVRIMSNMQAGMRHFNVLFDASLGVHDNHFEFLPISGNVRLLHVRGVKNYVAMEYATNTQYYDLTNFAHYVQHVYDASLAYEQAGSFSTSNGQMQAVRNVDIMEDVLTHALKVKKGDPMIATLRARVAKNVKSGDYVINGDTTTIYLGFGEVGMTIWPNEVGAGDKGTNANMTDLHGPGTVYNLSSGGVEPYQPTMDLGQGRVATLEKTEKNAAIYWSTEDQDDGKPAKVWSLMVEYKRNGVESRTNRVPLLMFTGMNALPAYHIQGLPGVEVGLAPQLGMLYGSTKQNGAIALYRNTIPDNQNGQNVRDHKGNCGGAVMAWGTVSLDQARIACEGSSKLP